MNLGPRDISHHPPLPLLIGRQLRDLLGHWCEFIWKAVCELLLKWRLSRLVFEDFERPVRRELQRWLYAFLLLLPMQVPKTLVLRVVLNFVRVWPTGDLVHAELSGQSLEGDVVYGLGRFWIVLDSPARDFVPARLKVQRKSHTNGLKSKLCC